MDVKGKDPIPGMLDRMRSKVPSQVTITPCPTCGFIHARFNCPSERKPNQPAVSAPQKPKKDHLDWDASNMVNGLGYITSKNGEFSIASYIQEGVSKYMLWRLIPKRDTIGKVYLNMADAKRDAEHFKSPEKITGSLRPPMHSTDHD